MNLAQHLTGAAKTAMNDEKNWRTCSPDCPPCAVCHKLVTTGVPLRLFQGDGDSMREMAFHKKCAFPPSIDDEPEEEEDPTLIVECGVCDQFLTCAHISGEERKRLQTSPDAPPTGKCGMWEVAKANRDPFVPGMTDKQTGDCFYWKNGKCTTMGCAIDTCHDSGDDDTDADFDQEMEGREN